MLSRILSCQPLSQILLPVLALFLATNLSFAQEKALEETMERQEAMAAEMKETLSNQLMLNQMIGLTRNVELMKEMEIVGEQREELQAIAQQYVTGIQKLNFELKDKQLRVRELVNEKRYEEAQDLAQEIQSSNSEIVTSHITKVNDVLLPHQVARMTQLSRQQYAKVQTPYAGFLGLPLALGKELELSAGEARKLKEVTEQADKELREELKALHEKKMKRVLDALPEDKREHFQDLVGDLYDREEAQAKMRRQFQNEAQERARKQREEFQRSQRERRKADESNDNSEDN